MQSLRCNLANCLYVTSLGSIISALYEQYTRDLSGLLDKHAPLAPQIFTKGATGWLSDSYLPAKAVRHQFEQSGVKTSFHKIGLDSMNRLASAIP